MLYILYIIKWFKIIIIYNTFQKYPFNSLVGFTKIVYKDTVYLFMSVMLYDMKLHSVNQYRIYYFVINFILFVNLTRKYVI